MADLLAEAAARPQAGQGLSGRGWNRRSGWRRTQEQGQRRAGPDPRARGAARRDRARARSRSSAKACACAWRAGHHGRGVGAAPAAGVAASGRRPQPPESQAEAADDPAKHPGCVQSPMVGTAYLAPEPGAATFVEVGTRVTQGQTILIIEAMKTMNHIPAPQGRHGHRASSSATASRSSSASRWRSSNSVRESRLDRCSTRS